MGDVALCTGPLLRWHEDFGLNFTMLTRAAFVPLFDHHPAIQKVIGLEKNQMHGKALREMFRNITADHAGATLVDLHGVPRTRLLSLMWKGPVYRYPKLALTRRLFLLSGGRLGRAALLEHTVPQRYASALDSLFPSSGWTPSDLRPRFFLSDEEKAEAAANLAELKDKYNAPLIALHPFATHPSKAWPVQRWQEFSTQLSERAIPHIWVGQGDAEVAPLSPFALNFINKTSLRQLIALLDAADLLVTGDSGPMHLADGVDTPVLALFGPTCREWGFFPSGSHDRVLQQELNCRPCSLHGGGKADGSCPRNHACMMSISAPAVLREAGKLLPELEG